MTNTNTSATVSSVLSNALTTSAKTGKPIQRALKAADFSRPDTYANYTRLCNLFITSLSDHINGDTDISKRNLTNALQRVYDHLELFEGMPSIKAESCHTRFILNHALNLSITAEGVCDIIKSERAIKRMIELCAYFELNGLAVPAVTLTEKAQKRMEKNAEKCGEMARKAAEKKRKEGEREIAKAEKVQKPKVKKEKKTKVEKAA